MNIDEKTSRIKLTRDERTALRIVSNSDWFEPSAAFGRVRYVHALMTLEQKGLVRCAWVEGRKDVEAVRLTPEGERELVRQLTSPRAEMAILVVIKGLLILVAAVVFGMLLLARFK